MFNTSNLSVYAYTNGQTMWSYKSTDALSQIIEGEAYFNDARDMLRPCDVIFITGIMSGKPCVALRQILTTEPNVTLARLV